MKHPLTLLLSILLSLPLTGCWDQDWDGIPDADDNCPIEFNPGQEDLDEDEIGDACDPDLDGDGVNNAEDSCPRIQNPWQTVAPEDGDEDGVGDSCDNCQWTPNPDQSDADEDGIGDVCESHDEQRALGLM